MSGAPTPQDGKGTGAFRRSQAPTPGRSADTFDLAAHHRQRIQQLEAHCDHLDAHRCKLERLLGSVLLLAVANTDVTVRALLDLLEELDTAGVNIAALTEKPAVAA